jgi:hypothetical protein
MPDADGPRPRESRLNLESVNARRLRERVEQDYGSVAASPDDLRWALQIAEAELDRRKDGLYVVPARPPVVLFQGVVVVRRPYNKPATNPSAWREILHRSRADDPTKWRCGAAGRVSPDHAHPVDKAWSISEVLAWLHSPDVPGLTSWRTACWPCWRDVLRRYNEVGRLLTQLWFQAAGSFWLGMTEAEGPTALSFGEQWNA